MILHAQKLCLTALLVSFLLPSPAVAYIGPGAGLSAIGTAVAVLGAVVLLVIGFVWYPIKRVLRRNRAAPDAGALTIIASASVAFFLVGFWSVGIVSSAKCAIGVIRQAMEHMRDPGLDELQRERAVQRAAIMLGALSASIIAKSLLVLGAALVPILLADRAGFASSAVSFEFMQRWDVVLIASGVATLGFVGHRAWQH